MSMRLDRRLQVLLDEERYERLHEVAQARGVSVATVVREAIDNGLATPRGRRLSAAARILDADDMPVPADPDVLRAELHAAHERRA
ncbi:MAG: ribbon-helix-helix protein, CopG family [Solirubrobacteraceae bacterium]